MFKFFYTFIVLCFLQSVNAAQTEANTIEFRWFYEGYFYVSRSYVADSVLNLGNEILNLPESEAIADQRLEAKLQINDGVFVLRPRAVTTYSHFKTENTKKDKSEADTRFNLTDAFYEQSWTSSFSTTVGLQVYQWGPAELLNASNPFFHFNSDQRSLVFKEKGKMLVRLNLNLTARQSLVLMVEPISNNEIFWVAEKKFQPQAALKYEVQSKSNASQYLGLVAGKSDTANGFFGEYGQLSFDSGLSFYFDAKHTLRPKYYEPVDRTLYVEMIESNSESDIASLAILGARYEGDFDLRFEYIYNSLGYSKELQKLALVSTAQLSPLMGQNLLRFQKNGLELLSPHYIYASLRKSNPFDWKDFNFYLRSLTAMTDGSGLEQIEIDKSVGDYLTVFGNGTLFRGDQDTEFKLFNDWKVSLGVKAMF